MSELDPVLKDILAQPGDPSATPVEEQDPDEARAEFEGDMKAVDAPPPDIGSVGDIKVAGADGELGARLFTPDGFEPGEGTLLIYFHGGGNIRGSLDTHDSTCRVLANASGARVLSVDYRLAPEHPFPAAADDAWAAFNWAHSNASDLGVSTQKIAVGGDSAGGNLAAVVALDARGRSGPPVAFQMLIYPVTDHVSDTESKRLYSSGYMLNSMPFYTASYLPDEADRSHPRASPAHALSLGDLPPAVVMTAGFDPLLDDGKAYADRLEAAGCQVDYVCFDTMIHGFISLRGLLPQAEEGLRRCAEAMRAVVG